MRVEQCALLFKLFVTHLDMSLFAESGWWCISTMCY